MLRTVVEGVDLLIHEGDKEILINPKGERFYFTECDESHRIYRNASLRYDEALERYEIEGDQTLMTEHYEMGFDYEELLCLHPSELIKRRSFFGVVWYRVSGRLHREVHTIYSCRHKHYRITRRSTVYASACRED